MSGCFLRSLCWGPGCQSRHEPSQGIQSATLWFTGQCSNHWATPARKKCFFFYYIQELIQISSALCTSILYLFQGPAQALQCIQLYCPFSLLLFLSVFQSLHIFLHLRIFETCFVWLCMVCPFNQVCAMLFLLLYSTLWGSSMPLLLFLISHFDRLSVISPVFSSSLPPLSLSKWPKEKKVLMMWGDRCVNFLDLCIISQCIRTPNHHVVHFKCIHYICQLFLNKAENKFVWVAQGSVLVPIIILSNFFTLEISSSLMVLSNFYIEMITKHTLVLIYLMNSDSFFKCRFDIPFWIS